MFLKKHPYKRKYKFIDKKQQIRFAVDVALHALLFPVFMLLLMILPPFSQWLLGAEAAANMRPILQDFYFVALNHWWVVLIALAFIGTFSVLFSHRVFGPMRRFENALVRKKENHDEYVLCNLRGGDYFHEFSKLMEEVINRGVTPPGGNADAPPEAK